MSDGLSTCCGWLTRKEGEATYRCEQCGKSCGIYRDDSMNFSLERELAGALNRHGWDTKCNMPDFVLADYLIRCLYAIRSANDRTGRWKGESKPWSGECQPVQPPFGTTHDYTWCATCRKRVQNLCDKSPASAKYAYQGIPLVTCENMPDGELRPVEPVVKFVRGEP